MPAVQLARLAQQIDNLAWQFANPAEFVTRLRDLFEYYANRVYRPGQGVSSRSLVLSYRVSPLVMRSLKDQLRGSCQQHPAAALALVDTLWKEPYLEYRQLASALLGQIPLQASDEIIQRLVQFARPEEDGAILSILLEAGGARLRAEQPALWIDLVKRWLAATEDRARAIGLMALVTTLNDERFANLPLLFNLFSPLLQAGPASLQAELQQCLTAFLQRTPIETAYFLRQQLSLPISAVSRRLVRLSLPNLPAELQPGLRQALQAARDD